MLNKLINEPNYYDYQIYCPKDQQSYVWVYGMFIYFFF